MANKYLGQRVWFADGTISTAEWDEMPEDGVVIRILYFADGTKQIQHGVDYYYESESEHGTIQGAGMDKDQIPERYLNAIIKRGKWINDEYYQEILEEAMASTWIK